MSHCCGGHKHEGHENYEGHSNHECCKNGAHGEHENIVLKVEGMTCDHCVMSIKKGVGEIKGVKKVDVSLKEGKVSIEHCHADINTIKTAVEDLGYDVK